MKIEEMFTSMASMSSASCECSFESDELSISQIKDEVFVICRCGYCPSQLCCQKFYYGLMREDSEVTEFSSSRSWSLLHMHKIHGFDKGRNFNIKMQAECLKLLQLPWLMELGASYKNFNDMHVGEPLEFSRNFICDLNGKQIAATLILSDTIKYKYNFSVVVCSETSPLSNVPFLQYPSQAASTAPQLRYGIIFAILLRLNVKTLSKLRCVSKSWNNIISDQIFTHAFRQQSEQSPLMLRASHKEGIIHFVSLDKKAKIVDEFTKSISISPPEWRESVQVAFTCADLVCMHVSDNVLICNPATRELLALPKQSSYDDLSLWDLIFGYLPSTKEYKVLSIFHCYQQLVSMCEVFTLSTDEVEKHNSSDSWRRVENFAFRSMWGSAFANGAGYVLPDYDYHEFREGIARFDFVTEEWSVIPPPAPDEITARGMVMLRQVGERLCLADVSASMWTTLDLWFLKEERQDTTTTTTITYIWEKEYSVNLSFWRNEYNVGTFEDVVQIEPVAIEQDGRVLIEIRYWYSKFHEMHKLGQLYYYDPKTNCLQLVGDVGYGECKSSLYVESFTAVPK